ncbi:MAG: GntR family transcriptional regulator [Eubacteriales bacterium]|nr:GntR family transcriptional regulator [Eubacteriales bacterium]
MRIEEELSELHVPRVRELFVKEIEALIISGKLSVGEKLPTERELSKKMKVSRAIVNGGLADMEAKGFLCVVPRKGTFVADYKRIGKLDTLLSIINYNGGHLNPTMFRSLTDMRTMIEKEAAEQAALNRSDDDVEALKSLLNQLKLETDPRAMAAIDFELHHTVCVASCNVITPLIFYSFINILSQVNECYYTNMDRTECLGYLERLVQAIEDKNPAEALGAVSASFSVGTKLVSEHMFQGYRLDI